MSRWTPAGRMSRVLSIEKPIAGTANAYGEIVDSWVEHARVYASVDELSGREYLAARASQTSMTHKINCRYVAGVDSTMRAVYQGTRYLYLESVRDVESRHRELEIFATEMVSGTAIVQATAPATSLEGRIVTRLTSDNTVAALVVDRVRPVILHHCDQLPAIVYRRSASSPVNVADGDTDTASCTISVECLGQTYTQCKVLAKAVRNCLSGWSDSTGTPSIASCHLSPEGDSDADPIPSQDTSNWTVVLDFALWYAQE